MPTQQTGPRLTITGRCEGCEHYTPTKIGGKHSAFMRCAHPSCAKAGVIFGDTAPTPAWCPELPAARLALARGIVAEAEPLALPLPGDAPVNPKPATWDDGERR